MKPAFIDPSGPLPEDRRLKPITEDMEIAALALVDAIMKAYPDEVASIEGGVNVFVMTGDGVCNHLFRMVKT